MQSVNFGGTTKSHDAVLEAPISLNSAPVQSTDNANLCRKATKTITESVSQEAFLNTACMLINIIEGGAALGQEDLIG